MSQNNQTRGEETSTSPFAKLLAALARRYRVEYTGPHTVIGGLMLTDDDLTCLQHYVAKCGWDGTSSHADELLGDWLDIRSGLYTVNEAVRADMVARGVL